MRDKDEIIDEVIKAETLEGALLGILEVLIDIRDIQAKRSGFPTWEKKE